MKVSPSFILIMLVLLLVLLIGLLAEPAGAQGPIVPTPPPVATPVNPIDAANARADQWQTVANQAVSSAQASINYAYGALANAQAGLYQAQAALQQEHAARVAAQQGQIQQAVEAAQSAQISAINAIGLMSQATNAAMQSLTSAEAALRSVPGLTVSLTAMTAQRDAALTRETQLDKDRAALAGALVAERQKSDLFGKVAIAALLLLAITVIYIAVVLWKLMRALRIKGTDRMVVLDERGMVKAQIEALN